jgi:hypothetical protein
MNEFKTMKFVREERDKIYEETKNKSPGEIRDYYKEKSSWLKPFLKKESDKNIKNNAILKYHLWI